MAYTTGQHKQMPDAVVIGMLSVVQKKIGSGSVAHSAQHQKSKSLHVYGVIEWLDGRHNEPSHDYV